MASNAHVREWFSERSLTVALVTYFILCIPAYLLIQGPVGDAGTVDSSVAIGGLLMGSLMFVPAIHSKLKRTYGGGQAARLGFTDESSE